MFIALSWNDIIRPPRGRTLYGASRCYKHIIPSGLVDLKTQKIETQYFASLLGCYYLFFLKKTTSLPAPV